MILVTGATGNVGRHVVAGLRDAGAPVRGLSRSSGPFRGDLRDPASLTAALDGVDTVFLNWPGPSGDGVEDAVEAITAHARALLTTDLDGERPELTGPANVTQQEQVRLIGEAVGRDVRWVELPPGTARHELLAEWGDAHFVDAALTYWASLVGRGEPVTDTVERVTGHPARTFRQWAADHVADFC